MSYVVLARKYRPRQFSELVGQQHVATTLLNAFRQNKLGQAYLLTGTRGVGKTSVARIFAKALRCESADAHSGGKHPGVSCDKCPSCIEINNGSSIDVLEIDGASNNGVENVREIREQVKFLPSRGRMKVYIIDEVHMLTNAAFNALLKTLEEPPSHVTFILATTEVQKIPATILSRCQRFDFRRVPQALIFDHLARLIELEGIKSEPAALRLIARKADGSVRDSLSALDQCLAMGGKKLTVEGVTESLGIVSERFLVKVLQHTFNSELIAAANMIHDAFLSGVEMKQIALGITEALRNALFVKLRAQDALVEVSNEEKADYEELVKHLSPEAIQAAYRSITASLDEILRSPLPKASLEMALARISGMGKLKSLEELVAALQSSAQSPKQHLAQSQDQKSTLPVFRIPNAEPTASTGRAPAEKKSAEIASSGNIENSARSQNGSPGSFSDFVNFVLKQKASLGALLEHAIPLSTNGVAWGSGAEVRIGFRKSHAFYQLQAQHKANFEQLDKALQAFLKKPCKLQIDTVNEEIAGGNSASLVEKEKKVFAELATEKKKRFLNHEIVKSTKEIFGAELSSFDIDKSKA